MKGDPETFEVTNTSRGVRVIHDANGRPVTFAPGQSRNIIVSPGLARQLSGKVFRVSGYGGGTAAPAVKVEPVVPFEDNPVAIDALVAKAEAGEVEWHDFQKQANVFLPNAMPARKVEIIEALKARSSELRKARS